MLKILFEDHEFIAVEKPIDLPSDLTRDPQRETAVTQLKNQRPDLSLVLLHRLDRDTSGILLFCKDPSFNHEAALLFQDRKIEKVYTCIVPGSFPKEQMQIKNYLKLQKISAKMSIMVSTKSGGKLAITDFNCLKKSNTHSLLEARPLTGRTHQIRVHLSEMGFPIVGEILYDDPARIEARLYLHASQLNFTNPRSQQQIKILCPPTEDFYEGYF